MNASGRLPKTSTKITEMRNWVRIGQLKPLQTITLIEQCRYCKEINLADGLEAEA